MLGDNFGALALANRVPATTPQDLQQNAQEAARTSLAFMQQAAQQKQQQFANGLAQAQLAQQNNQFITGQRDDARKQVFSAHTPNGADFALESNRNYFTPEEFEKAKGAIAQFRTVWNEERQQKAQENGWTPAQSESVPTPTMGMPGIPPQLQPPNPIGNVSMPPAMDTGIMPPGTQNIGGQPMMPPLPPRTLLPNTKYGMIDPRTREVIGASGEDNGAVDVSGELKNEMQVNKILANPTAYPPHVVASAKEFNDRNSLTPQALDYWSNYVLKTGQRPPITGLGAAKVLTQVANNTAKVGELLNLAPEEIAAAGAEYSANKGAITKLAGMQMMVDSYSDFTDRQLGQLETTLNALTKVASLQDSRLLNKPVVEWERNIKSSPEAQAYLQQLQSTRTEIARLVTASSQMGGQLTVQAMQEWNKVAPDSMTPRQVGAFINQSRKEIANRADAFEDQRTKLRDKILSKSDPEHGKKVMAGWSNIGVNAPQPGDTEGGYRFKGGNPADKSNWEKVE